jgi:hypothetical protein
MSRGLRFGVADWERHQEARNQRFKAGTSIDPAPEVAAPLERDILGPALQTLNFHPNVAFAWRANSGKFKVDGERWMVVNFKGCSDILGMLKDGRFLAVECKRRGEQPSPEQQSFLNQVNAAGGLGICVHSIAELNALVPPWLSR